MKKIILSLILSILTITCCVGFTACTKKDNFSVSFYVDGSLYETVSTKASETIKVPENPTKDGCNFDGWYLTEDASSEKYVFDKMPENNINVYAKWTVNIEFDSMGGSEVAPMFVREGSSFDIDVRLFPTKDGYIFTDWYLDENYTERYMAGVYEFTRNTTLYAKYSEVVSTEVKTYFSDETTFLNQKDTFCANAVSQQQLNDDNVGEIITLTSLNDAALPTLEVNYIKDYNYNIEPKTAYEAGGSYVMEIKTPHYFTVNFSEGEEGETGQVNKIYFTIEAENKSEVQRKEEFTVVERPDYYSLSEKTLYLKQTFAFESNIAENSILKIEKDDGSYIFGKVSDVGITNIGGVKAVVVNLTEASFNEIYENVDIYETSEIDINSWLEDVDLVELANEMADDEDYESFQYLSLCAVADYVNASKIADVKAVNVESREVPSNVVNMAYIDTDKNKFSLKKGKDGTIYIDASFRVVIDEDTYATVTVDLEQYFTVRIKTDVDIGINWHFDVSTYIASSTTLDFSIVLNFDGEEYDIKKIMQSAVANPTPKGFVEVYRRNLDMDTKSLTLFSKQLIRPKGVVGGILEIAIPIKFNVNVDVNAAFSSRVEFTISKVYGIKGKKGKGVWDYKQDVLTRQISDLYYSGYVGLEMGISVSLELCFKDLDFMGKVGISIEVGAYYDFYGYGSTYYSKQIVDDDKKEYTKVRGGTCWEVGVYLKMSLYASSDIFDVSAEAELFKKKYPLIKGGNEYVAVDFNDKLKEREFVRVTKDGLNLNSIDYSKLVYINLKTGKTLEKLGQKKLFLIFTSGYFEYDSSTNTLSIIEKYNKVRREGTLIIEYIYDVYTTKQLIQIKIPLIYVPEEIGIPDGDLLKKNTVEFKVNGIFYKSVEVNNGSCCRPPRVSSDWLDAHPEISVAWYDTDTIARIPITEDCSFDAIFTFSSTKVLFQYQLVRKDNIGVYNDSAIGEIYRKNIFDLENELYDFNKTLLPNYTFVGWDYTGDGIPDDDRALEYNDIIDVLECVAIYEDTPFTVYLHIGEIKNNTGEVLLAEQTVSDEIRIGETPNFKYETVPGYYLNIDNVLWQDYYPCNFSKTLEGTLVRNEIFPVTVYDAGGNILVQDNSAYTDDKSDIMNSNAVTNYTPVYASTLPIGYEAEFIGWANVEFTKSVKFVVEIYPIFDIKLIEYTIKFDGGEGEIPAHMQYAAENGISVYKNEQLTEEFIAEFTPKKQSTDTCDYVFDGWYYNDEKGVKPATESRTYVARFTETERKYKLIILADYQYMQQTGETSTSIAIEGTFDNGTDKVVIEDLSYARAVALCDEIENGNYTSANGASQPSVIENDYIFIGWNTSLILSDNEFEVAAKYKKNNFVRLGLDAGNGSFDAINYGVTLWTEFSTDNASEDFVISSFLQPSDNVDTFIYNEELKIMQQKFGAYVDENYLYTFRGWSLDGATVLASDYTLAIPQNEEKIVTAIYDKTPIAKMAVFSVNEDDDSEGLYIFEDDTWKPRGASYTIIRNYGTKISKDELPIARKELSENSENLMEKYLFEYTYEWQCVETGEIVKDDFDTNYTYKAVFTKVSRKINITLTAEASDVSTCEPIDAEFVFSNGKSSIVITVDSGTVIDESLLEIPTCSDETIKFSSWNYYLPITEYYDISIIARFYK